MWRNIIAILFLTAHVNTTMFIAQLDEVDTYDAHGRRQNDINTLGEYIHDILLHHTKKSRPDEDDDNARYFHAPKSNDLFSVQSLGTDEKPFETVKTIFPLFIEKKIHSVSLDFQGPPPKL